MPTIIKFNAADEKGLDGILVDQSADEVQNQWDAADGRHGLLHLTRDDRPVRVNVAAVAYWIER